MPHPRVYPRILLLLLAVTAASCYQRTERLPRAGDRDERPTLDVGVVPTRTPRDEILRYAALAEALSEATGRRISIRPAATTTLLRERLEDGELDLAVLGAVAYARSHAAAGTVALAHEMVLGQVTYRASIVVRDDSRIRSIDDLADCRLALVDPESTTGQLLPLAGLAAAEFDRDRLAGIRYLDRQEEVVRAVRIGEADAGAVREETSRRHLGQGLRAIWTSDATSGPVLVAHAGLEPELREAVRAVLLDGPRAFPPAVRTVPTENVPRYAPCPDATGDLVAELMARIYGPDALRRDLRLPKASSR